MIYADRLLSQRLERTEAKANAAFVATRGRIQPEHGALWIDVAGAYAMFDGISSPLTQTFGLGLFDPVSEKELALIENFFAKQGAAVHHEVSPLAESSLMPLFNARGYQPIESTSVMYMPLVNANKNLAINPSISTRVIEPGEEAVWAKTSTRGWASESPDLSDFMFEFGLISAQCDGGYAFLAEQDGQPISTGMLFIFDGIALLGGASTIPECRRRGAQSALLQTRLNYAATKGCTIAMMCAAPGSQSQRNAEVNGFRIAYTRTKWALRANANNLTLPASALDI